MSALLEYISCPDYQFDSLDLNKISQCIDRSIINKFADQKIVIRGIQSEKHDIPKDKLVQLILDTGTDRHGAKSDHAIKVNDRPIDLFGFGCKAHGPLTLSVLEGFHKWKPMSLERPQLRVDIWMIYDANQLENVEYNHSYYNVKARDGYLFKNPNSKPDALLGVFVIN
jgi:hypothetical protein